MIKDLCLKFDQEGLLRFCVDKDNKVKITFQFIQHEEKFKVISMNVALENKQINEIECWLKNYLNEEKNE